MWGELIGKVLLILVVVKSVEVESKLVETIQCPQVTNWGSWRNKVSCPPGFFVTAYRLRNQRYQGYFSDDQALTAIEMRCSDGTILSSGSEIGDWSNWVSVPSRHCFTGVQMRVDCSTWTLDQVSTVNMKMHSSDGTWLTAMAGHDWGTWGKTASCPSGYCICGMTTQHDSSSWFDKTATNNIKFHCCEQ